MTEARRWVRRMLGRVPGLLALARLVIATVRVCLRYRVTGLASEAGFFALLSLPPLVLGLFGGLGYLGDALGQEAVDRSEERRVGKECRARWATDQTKTTTEIT